MPAACSELATWRARRRSSFALWPPMWELGRLNFPGSFWGHMGSNVRSARLLVWKGNGLLVEVPWNSLRMRTFVFSNSFETWWDDWKPSQVGRLKAVISSVHSTCNLITVGSGSWFKILRENGGIPKWLAWSGRESVENRWIRGTQKSIIETCISRICVLDDDLLSQPRCTR